MANVEVYLTHDFTLPGLSRDQARVLIKQGLNKVNTLKPKNRHSFTNNLSIAKVIIGVKYANWPYADFNWDRKNRGYIRFYYYAPIWTDPTRGGYGVLVPSITTHEMGHYYNIGHDHPDANKWN